MWWSGCCGLCSNTYLKDPHVSPTWKHQRKLSLFILRQLGGSCWQMLSAAICQLSTNAGVKAAERNPKEVRRHSRRHRPRWHTEEPSHYPCLRAAPGAPDTQQQLENIQLLPQNVLKAQLREAWGYKPLPQLPRSPHVPHAGTQQRVCG